MAHRQFHAQFPCTPADAKRIRRNALDNVYSRHGTHPLEGKSVAEWVAEARAGWPKVPVPKDPVMAAYRVINNARGGDRAKWDTPTLEFD